MKRTTVYLGADVALASQHAKQRGRAKARPRRETVAEPVGRRNPTTGETLPFWVGAGDSGGDRTDAEELRPLPRPVGKGRSGSPDWAEHGGDILLELLDREYEESLASHDEAQKEKAGR